MEEITIINNEEDIYSKISNDSLLHKEICVFVVNDNKQVLLQKRSADKKYYPNKWTLLTGHVENNESFLIAAKREIKEEIGIDIDKEEINVFAYRKFTDNNINYDITCFFYIKSNLKEENFTIQKEELSQVKWFNIDDVIDMINKHNKDLLCSENKIKLFKFLNKL